MRNERRTDPVEPAQSFIPASCGGDQPPPGTNPKTLAGLATIYEFEGFHLRIKARSWASFCVALRRFGCERLPTDAGRPGVWRQVGPPDCTNRTAVEGWLRVMVERDKLAPASANGYLGNVAAIASDAGAVCDDRTISNVFENVRRLSVPEKLPRCPPVDAVERLATMAEHPGETAVVRLALLGGRTREIFALRLGDFDPHAGTVRLVRSRKRETSRKNGASHVIPLDPVTLDALRWVVANHDALWPAHGKRPGDDLLFPFASERWYGERLAVWRAGFGADADAYMPEGTGLYALRHLGATLVAQATGGDAQAIARHLGDRSLKIASVYASQLRGGTSSARADLAAVARVVDGARKPPDAPPPAPAAPAPVPRGPSPLSWGPGVARGDAPDACGDVLRDVRADSAAGVRDRAGVGAGLPHLSRGGAPGPATGQPPPSGAGMGLRGESARPRQLRISDPATSRAAARRAGASRWGSRMVAAGPAGGVVGALVGAVRDVREAPARAAGDVREMRDDVREVEPAGEVEGEALDASADSLLWLLGGSGA